MASTDSKSKYARFLKSPKWNETLFSQEGYLLTRTNLDPKDERSYYHKENKTFLSLDWVASPKVGILLSGTRSAAELVEIKFLSKGSDGKWSIDETKTKEAETKYKEHGLLAIHTTETECPTLYHLSKVLADKKVILDLSVGILVDTEPEFLKGFDKDAFTAALSSLVDFFLTRREADPIFDDFREVDPEGHACLYRLGFEANLLNRQTLRRNRLNIPGVSPSELPTWETLAYTGAEVVDAESTAGGFGGSRRTVTPKDKLDSFLSLLEDAEAVSRLLAACKKHGYTPTPSEVISCLYGLSSGVYLPFSEGEILPPSQHEDENLDL